MPKTDDDLPVKSVSSVRPAGIANTQKYDAAQIDKLEGLKRFGSARHVHRRSR
jgi:hypothetical protein